MDDYTWGAQNTTALTANWRIFDGDVLEPIIKRLKQAAEESAYNFASTRDGIRLEVRQLHQSAFGHPEHRDHIQ